MKKKLSGFTLVELSIVLVIIGLLVGGIIEGGELIQQAKISKQISQIQEYRTALKTFQLKYDNIPGDINLSLCQSLGFTCNTTYPEIHNGDGSIGDVYLNNPVAVVWGEIYYAFIHLSEAKLLKGKYLFVSATYGFGSGTPAPKTELGEGGFFMLSYKDKVSLLSAVVSDNSIPTASATGSFSPEQAHQLDLKLDNGIPSSGKIKAVNTNFSNDITANSCVLTITAADYNVTSQDTKLCRLLIEL